MPARIATRRFELLHHDPEWALIAEREAIRIERALGDSLLQIEHIGSTSIPGIKAKPIIDLMPIATSLAALDGQRHLLEALGYEWRGEFGFPGRRYCIFNDPKTGTRKFHAHFYQEGFFEIERYIAFRDYLRHFDAEARLYEAEKVRAWQLHPQDVKAYQLAKTPWIEACLLRALAWRKASFQQS